MRRSAARSSGTANLSSKILTPAPASDLPPPRKLHKRRRSTNPIFPAANAGARSRRDGGASSGRRSGPTIPLLRWNFDDADRSAEHPPESGSGKVQRKHQNVAGEAAPAVSARKLAAALWQLQLPEASGGCGDRGGARLGFELEASVALSNCVMERATKWDPGCAKASDEVYRFYDHQKLLEDQQLTTVSVVSAHQAELEQAHNRISELEAERRSAKKKLDHFLRKLAEEKASWRKREHEKIRAVMDAMKDELNRERKNRQRMEIMNSKLVNELAEAKLSAKRCLQDYEKERKARELMEEVCDELAKEIGEDKAEVEALKRESIKIREEVEEERKMLQMAEVWREERVQMKLVDAKLTLEEKYSQLSKLQKDLEAFLKERNDNHPAKAKLKEAEMLRKAANSLKVQDVREFSYQPPPASEDIFAVFEELQAREEMNDREIEQCYGYGPASHASDVQTESPETDVFLEKPTKRYVNGIIKSNGDMEDDSGWETVSHVEEQGSSNSPGGSDPSVNGIYRKSNASVSGIDWDENGDNGKLNSEISEVCSATTRKSRKKASSISRLWRSSCPNNGENYKKISFEVPNGRKSKAILSPDRKAGEVGLSSPSEGQWSSPDSLNPHITQGTKGCIEWPRGMQKHSLKAKLLEARMESQKAVVGWIEAPRILTLSVHLDMPSKDATVIEVSCNRVHQKSESWMQLEASVALSNCVMERATKWDPGCAKASDEVYRFYDHQKLLEDQQLTTVSVVSAHQAELEQAHNRISELEAERRSAKKKLDHFLRKLAEEKASWRKREHEKIRAVMDAMKDELNRERKNRQRMEIMNSKLVNELAEAKLSAKRCLQDYEKERKARELMEEVCDELAKEIGEDKAEVEALKRESIKIREEVEEERKMLQMAEVWREERVQMKLVDAKLTLEEKYSQLSKLQKDLEAFLKERNDNHPAKAKLKEAEMLRKAANSLKVQDVREFSYQPPPASEDIFAVFEELQAREEMNDREIEQCYGYGPASHASDVQTESPETDVFLEKPTKRYVNGIIKSNGDMEDDSGWETVSHVEEQGSSNSPGGSDPSVNGIYRKSNASVSGIDWDENGDNGKLNSEISEVCSATTRKSRKKASSISRLWRSSCPNNGENYKKISFEVPNGRKSKAILSPDRKAGEVGLSSPSEGQWSSPDSLNPHITQGTKGCIEWPRGMQKHSLKAKLLEARMESQKAVVGWIEAPRILTLSVHLDMPSKDATVIEVSCNRVHQKSESWMQGYINVLVKQEKV
ncbi:hypothetical protein COCNU_06G011820 [Cocos nucifera]|uniref:Uncharacterized protein n=1 Tax=Cocos nucifera TaxID=13894 RepID=A0A8K0IBM9_COCNU|nr:hypothetical protein COCNU_06G011820 [Cocos nucifera]